MVSARHFYFRKLHVRHFHQYNYNGIGKSLAAAVADAGIKKGVIIRDKDRVALHFQIPANFQYCNWMWEIPTTSSFSTRSVFEEPEEQDDC